MLIVYLSFSLMNLRVVFDSYNKINMELHIYQEIHDQLVHEKNTIETVIQTNLYDNWMKKIKIGVIHTDKRNPFERACDSLYTDDDKDLKLIIINIFMNNQNKPLQFFDDIIDDFCKGSLCKDTVLGRRDIFKTYLMKLQHKSYERDWISNSSEPVSDEIVERSLKDLINELDDDCIEEEWYNNKHNTSDSLSDSSTPSDSSEDD